MRKVKLLLFFFCRTLGLFRLARWITSDRLKILCYHGFALNDETAFRPKLFIKPERFEERLATIRRCGFRVLPLGEAVERLYSGTLQDNSLVITIDDGFHSVHRLAVPRLKQHGFPATVYLTTYYVEHPNPIFRLVVQYMFWKTARRTLELKSVPWAPDGLIDLSVPAQKEKAMSDCIRHGESQCTEDMRCALGLQLGTLLDVSYEDIVRSRILHLMTPEELQSLASAKIDVELHTHRHVFPINGQETAQREIVDNRAAIQRLLGREASHFCYPSGLWDESQWQWLDALSVKSSTTCIPGLNSGKTPRHALRRFLDGENIHSLEFEAALSGFSDLLRRNRSNT